MNRSAARALGVAQKEAARGDLWTALERLRETLRSPDRLGPQWAAAVALASQIGDETGAMLAARRLYDEAPRTAMTACVLAATLAQFGLASEAVKLLVPLGDAGRLSPDETFKLTRMLMFAGRIEEAHQRARALLRNEPDSPTLWERIAQTKRFEAGDPDIDAMVRAFHRWPESKPSGQAAIAAALAKAFVDIGDDESANKFLETRAYANRARFPFDPRALEAAARDVLEWCESDEPEEAVAALEGTQRPIFILGAVRSGTTLLEQILSRHPLVQGGGELKHLWLAACMLGDHSAACTRAHIARTKAAQPQSDPWSEVGWRYLLLADERFGPQSRFTDKLLSNVHRVRSIRQSLPQARILYVRRNALDTAWSCWRAQLDADAAWGATQAGTALYLASVAKIMTAWMKRYPRSIVEVSYERLASDPEVEIPRVLAACGLADDPATRQPHLAKRDVMTLSFAEVRRPISTARIDAANAFPKATRKLRESLAAVGLEV